VRKVVEKF